MLVTESWWAVFFSFLCFLRRKVCTIISCEYAAICRKQYGRDRDPVGNGCLLGKVLVKGSAFLSLHVGSGDGTTFCEVTMQSSLLGWRSLSGWRTAQSCLFRYNITVNGCGKHIVTHEEEPRLIFVFACESVRV